MARAVMAAFDHTVDTWTFSPRAQNYLLCFHVPTTEAVSLLHFVAARDVCRRARVLVSWHQTHLRFSVRIPRAKSCDGNKRKRSSKVDGHLDKKQRHEDGGD